MNKEENQWFECLYIKSSARLFKFASRLLGSEETARELVQEAFIVAVTKISELMTHPNPEGWLMDVMKRLISNEIRRSRKRKEVGLESAADIAADSQLEPGFLDCLPGELSANDKEILLLRCEQGLSFKEIGERMSINEELSRLRFYRAKERCRKYVLKEKNIFSKGETFCHSQDIYIMEGKNDEC